MSMGLEVEGGWGELERRNVPKHKRRKEKNIFLTILSPKQWTEMGYI